MQCFEILKMKGSCATLLGASNNIATKSVKYLGATLTDQNCIHEEIRSRLNSGNTCYHVVQNLISSRLLSTNVKIKIYETIIEI
jgi:hypothetical protein